jgi:hypothetical protein
VWERAAQLQIVLQDLPTVMLGDSPVPELYPTPAAAGGGFGGAGAEAGGAQGPAGSAGPGRAEGLKEACDICYSPETVPDEERSEQCLACSGGDAEGGEGAGGGVGGEDGGMRQEVWSGVSSGQSLGQQERMKEMWEEQQRQQQQLRLQVCCPRT